MKVVKEWLIQAPWGKMALISWGNSNGEPVLLVHGRQDSVSTFVPLLQYCPDNYYYVGFDMPGNGRSEPFPIGVKLSRTDFILGVDVVVKHLGWKQFTYVGHSMGADQGLFYNAIYPHRIKKLILLDFGPSLQRLQIEDMVEIYQYYYSYYTNYDKEHRNKVYTKDQAIKAVMKARHMTKEQAELILERNLTSVGDGKYRLSWDGRLRNLVPTNCPVDYYYQIFSKNLPPTLLIQASIQNSRPYAKGKEKAEWILKKLEEEVGNFRRITVEGGHDVHFTNPERLAKEFVQFLTKNINLAKL